MTWHTVGSMRGHREQQRGVWVSIVAHKRNMVLTIYRDVLDEIGWRQKQRVMVDVGADHHAGMLRVRLAGEDEQGLCLSATGDHVQLRIRMGRFPVPILPPRPIARVASAKLVAGALEIVLPGDLTRALRTGQEAMAAKVKNHLRAVAGEVAS